MLVLKRGQQGPDYRTKKDLAAGLPGKVEIKSEERIRIHPKRSVWLP